MNDFFTALEQADKNATLFINGIDYYSDGAFWKFLGGNVSWFVIFILAFVLLFIRSGWKKSFVVIAGVGLSILICDQFANLIKDLAARPRPCYDDWMLENGLKVLVSKGHRYGFFSAHAANSFAFAVCTCHAFKWPEMKKFKTGYTAIALSWATIISISRIFLGKHYLGDIIVGTIVGITVGMFVGLLADKIIERISPSPSSLHGNL